MKKYFILFSFILLPSLVFAQEAQGETVQIEPQIRPSIRIINSENFQLEKEIYPFAKDSTVEGINITSADLDNDGYKEILVASGRNSQPYIKILNFTGDFQYEFLAYAPSFNKGLKVTVADLYNDGSPEILAAPLEGGGPQIRIFDNLGFAYFSFFAFDQDLRGGVNVAAGDVNGDSQKEIIAGAGLNMEPTVKIFDNYSNYLSEFLAYEENYRGGVNVLTADLNNDGTDEIITAPSIGKEPMVKIFNHQGELINKFLAYPYGFWGGVNLAKSDVDQDGYLEIITGAGFSGGSHIRFFDSEGNPKINPKLFVYNGFKGGVSVADGDLDNDGETEILAATQTISPINRYDFYKIIDIDLNKQMMYTFFKGLPADEFIVSTGRWQFPTPEGSFKIYAKVPSTTMTGYYGPDHPENYNLPNVPHVMPFYKDYAIHGAYWHFNFGTRVSHGCVNLKLPDAEKLYNWADHGIPVNIYSSQQ